MIHFTSTQGKTSHGNFSPLKAGHVFDELEPLFKSIVVFMCIIMSNKLRCSHEARKTKKCQADRDLFVVVLCQFNVKQKKIVARNKKKQIVINQK